MLGFWSIWKYRVISTIYTHYLSIYRWYVQIIGGLLKTLSLEHFLLEFVCFEYILYAQILMHQNTYRAISICNTHYPPIYRWYDQIIGGLLRILFLLVYIIYLDFGLYENIGQSPSIYILPIYRWYVLTDEVWSPLIRALS